MNKVGNFLKFGLGMFLQNQLESGKEHLLPF